ncbi:hypothetical protein SAMN05661077_1300 [Thiohalorhabdus denitrificans]|uniref:Uncharacterized protein n=1 Tax=Thiohalorhabdus denitrificans TaxID=381306 RepID=A0A1G5DEG0_9GAMM|nr:hypothetical protein SAMN05661077_1300 [Thiohalorhabdus denitrificans]
MFLVMGNVGMADPLLGSPEPSPSACPWWAAVETEGQSQDPDGVGEESPEGGEKNQLANALDNTHASITRGLEYTVRQVDAFFANERVFEEATDSYLQMEGSAVWSKRGGTRFGGDIKARAELPRLERKWALLFESDGETTSGEDRDGVQRRPKEVVEQNDYFLSVQRRLNGDSEWDIRPSAGVKVKYPPDPFARLRVYRYFDMGAWLGRASGDTSWFVSDGFGAGVQWDLDRALGRTMMFRATTSFGWQEKNDYYKGQQKLTLFHDLSDHDAFAYEGGMVFTDEESWAATEYFVRADYRRELTRRWLYLDITPEVSFPRSRGFREERSLTVTLGVIFGREYLRRSEGR